MARLAPHRGAAENPAGRFERIHLDAGTDYVDPAPASDLDLDLDPDEDASAAPPTELFRDPSRRAFAHNESPDIPFDTSLNPYRGCEHGCVYCFARPSHEYLGLSAGLDFETKLMVKQDLPQLVRQELSARRWRPRTVAIGAVTDAYQPVERRLRLTRRCLEVFCEFRNPLSIVTKSALVTRDADLLADLARDRAASVAVSITSLDPALQRVLEPRAAAPSRRLAAVRELTAAGVPVSVMVAPVIPGLNDHEAPAIVAAAAEAGALEVRYLMLRLPHGVKELFASWLERHFPERKEKVLRRVREMRGGRLNDPRFGHRHRGEGFFAEQTASLFELACRRARLPGVPTLSAAAFRRPGGEQLALL